MFWLLGPKRPQCEPGITFLIFFGERTKVYVSNFFAWSSRLELVLNNCFFLFIYFFEKSWFDFFKSETIIIIRKLKLFFLVLNSLWPLKIDCGTNVFLRLLQSFFCFKVMRVLNCWLKYSTYIYLSCWSNFMFMIYTEKNLIIYFYLLFNVKDKSW